MQKFEHDEWDIKAAGSRWKSIVPRAKWNVEIRRYVEERMDKLQQIPFPALIAAMENFAQSEAMRDAGHPYRAFWSNPESWMPRQCAEMAYSEPEPGSWPRTTGNQPPAAYKPKERDFVALWNEHCPSSPTDQSLYRAFGWREAVSNERFAAEFETLAKTVERLRKSSDYSWMTLPWLLNQKPGNAKRNWERVLDGEFKPRGCTVNMETVRKMTQDRLEWEAKMKEAMRRQKAEREKQQKMEEERREREIHQEWLKKQEEKLAKMTPEEREEYRKRREESRQMYRRMQETLASMGKLAKRVAV